MAELVVRACWDSAPQPRSDGTAVDHFGYISVKAIVQERVWPSRRWVLMSSHVIVDHLEPF